MSPKNQVLIRELDSARYAHEEGNKLAFMEALYWCDRYDKPAPAWVVKAARNAFSNTWTGRKRTAVFFTVYKRDMIDLARFEAVEDMRAHNISPADSFEAACLVLKGTLCAGEEDTIEKAYKRVKKRKNEAPRRYKILSIMRNTNNKTSSVVRTTPERLNDWEYIFSVAKKG